MPDPRTAVDPFERLLEALARIKEELMVQTLMMAEAYHVTQDPEELRLLIRTRAK